MEIFNIITLAFSGLLLSFVGSMRLSSPKKTYAKNSGIELSDDVNLLNEMRGVSAVMLFSGIIILLGIFLEQLSFSAHMIACLLFLGFAFGRIISINSDGKPGKEISQGLLFELVLGGANLIYLILT